ncbi:MAG: JAB domain-containing protein [Chitinophagaceae bacterium]
MKSAAIQTLFNVTEVELVYRNKVNPAERPKITSSSTAYDILMEAWDMNKIELVEQFSILLLDRSNSCIGISTISQGGISACVVDPKVVFATALKARASSIILAHNHPSGNLKPSEADKTITKSLVAGGHILDLRVLDHLIVTPRSYYSFADEGGLRLD